MHNKFIKNGNPKKEKKNSKLKSQNKEKIINYNYQKRKDTLLLEPLSQCRNTEDSLSNKRSKIHSDNNEQNAHSHHQNTKGFSDINENNPHRNSQKGNTLRPLRDRSRKREDLMRVRGRRLRECNCVPTKALGAKHLLPLFVNRRCTLQTLIFRFFVCSLAFPTQHMTIAVLSL